MATAQVSPTALRLRRGRLFSGLLVLVLLGFSPTVIRSVQGHLAAPAVQPLTALPPPLRPSPAVIQGYAQVAQAFQGALDEVQPSAQRRLALSEQHFELYRQARRVLGPNRALAAMALLSIEIRNQNPARARRSVYGSPEAALLNVQTWLGYLDWAYRAPRTAAELKAAAPTRMATFTVQQYAPAIRAASWAARLPPGILAAIVDNEQSGQGEAYGLAGYLRQLTDTVAQRTSEAYGDSGLSGDLSQTVGLTQMSWRDALAQRPRFHALGMQLSQSFPTTEAQARAVLADPADNLRLTASRLVGYLDVAEGAGTHAGATAYFLGPAWHNNPALASSGQTWAYAWTGFFKACLYGHLLEPGLPERSGSPQKSGVPGRPAD